MATRPDSPLHFMIMEYTNPLISQNLADPFILKANDNYYLFATGQAPDGRRLPIYCSSNLRDWTFVRGAVAQGAEGSWNRRNFWAPEVMFLDGKYHLYYTAMPDGTPQNEGNRVGLAVGTTPDGPYEDVGVVVPHGSIDGSPFFDTDGALYLFYTIEHGNHDGLKAGQIYVDRMVSPLKIAGKPVQLISHHEWQEGPCLLYSNGRYLLTYSTGNWTNDTYGVRWATGKSVQGPFTEQPDKILTTTELVKGPGHHNIFIGPNAEPWLIYHGWDPGLTMRMPRIDPLIIGASSLSSPGPTMGRQIIAP